MYKSLVLISVLAVSASAYVMSERKVQSINEEAMLAQLRMEAVRDNLGLTGLS